MIVAQQVSTVTKVFEPVELPADAMSLARDLFEPLAIFKPAKLRIKKAKLEASPELCETLASQLEMTAELLEAEVGAVEFTTEVNAKVAELTLAIEANSLAFYEQTKNERAGLYSLKAALEQEAGDVHIFPVDAAEFLDGSGMYFERLVNILKRKFKKFIGREVPSELSLNWPIERAEQIKRLGTHGQSILAQWNVGIPIFDKIEDAVAWLQENIITNGDTAGAFVNVIATHGHGAAPDNLPFVLAPSFAARLSSGRAGINLSGNNGPGILGVQGPHEDYFSEEIDNAGVLAALGAIFVTDHGIVHNTVTTHTGDKASFRAYSAMNAYCAVTRALRAYGIDILDTNWTDDSKDRLVRKVQKFISSLYDINEGRRVILKTVSEDEILVERDPETKIVTIKVDVSFVDVVGGVDVCIDPVIPDQD